MSTLKKRKNGFFGFMLILAAVLAFGSCGDGSDKDRSAYLPPSQGKSNELLIIIDTSTWKGETGKALREVLQAPMLDLPQPEPLFDILKIQPNAFNKLLQRHKNLIFVTAFDTPTEQTEKMKKFFSKASLAKVEKDTSLFMLTQKDVFAQKQFALHLFNKNDEGLANKIRENKAKIQQLLLENERKRILAKLAKMPKSKAVGKLIAQNTSLRTKIPVGFQIAKEEMGKDKGVLWLRHPEVDYDLNLFLAYRPYTTDSVFVDVQAFRDSLVSQHVFGNPDKPDSYMSTEPTINASVKKISYKKRFAKTIRGIWITNSVLMAGPYSGMLWLDEKQNRLYYFEGFINAPGFDKRDKLRELEAIIWNSVKK